MDIFTKDITLGELAARRPAAASVFERHGLDYCCGGGQEFDQACRSKGLEPATLLAEIEGAQSTPAAAVEPDWSSASLDLLVDHIVGTHHVFLKTQLPRLEGMLAKVLAQHGSRHGAVLEPLAATLRAMHAEIEGHLMKEEMVLFPLIRSLTEGSGHAFHCGSVNNPIRVMLAEHDSAGEALRTMRQLTGGYQPPEDACTTFRAVYAGLAEVERDLHQHIHLENNILFPRAAELESRR